MQEMLGGLSDADADAEAVAERMVTRRRRCGAIGSCSAAWKPHLAVAAEA